jgi:hypothetical protein
LVSRQLQPEDEAPQRRYAHAQALLAVEVLASLGQRRIAVRLDQLAHLGQGRRIAEGPSAAGVRARGAVPAGTAPSQAFFHEGLTTPKEGGNGALGAALLLTGAENLLAEVKRGGFHTRQHHAGLPYMQSITALSFACNAL